MKNQQQNKILCSIIIPVFNKWELTKNCLESLHEHTPSGTYEVIVVDNASTDATVEELEILGKALFGSLFTLLRFSHNKNFGPACNAGAKKAQADMLFFLNNDTLMTPQWFTPLYESFSRNPRLGAVGPLLLYENDTVQHLGVVFYSTITVGHLYKKIPREHPVVNKKRRLQAITGAAFMIPKTIFLDIGGFYEEYRNGFEDVDLCLHLVQKKYEIECVTDSVIYHLESQTAGRNDALAANSLVCIKRCAHLFYVDWHHHALRDGFNAVLDELDRPRVVVSDKESASLMQQIDTRFPESAVELVNKNPYWVAGYDFWANALEQCKLFAESTHARLAHCQLFLTLGNAKKLLSVAIASGQKDLIDEAQAILKQLEEYQESQKDQDNFLWQVQRNRLKGQLTAAQNTKDAYLEKLYTKALHKIL